MQAEKQSDFSERFAPFFDPPLRPVDVVYGLTPHAFETLYRRPRRPVIIGDGAKAWPAMTRWARPARLKSLSGHRPAFVRDLQASSVDADNYHEAYREVTFGELVERLFSEEPPAWYLTQGLVTRGNGIGALLGRNSWPAHLPELAEDLRPPPYWPEEDLTECNLWFGPGGQCSGLHYDEYDNLNGAVVGSKRWLLFPHHQTQRLLNGTTGHNSIAPGFTLRSPTGLPTSAHKRAALSASPNPVSCCMCPQACGIRCSQAQGPVWQ
ncbi:MAG: cupin-like domain-containing protein [Burkholderiaceae bacterium]